MASLSAQNVALQEAKEELRKQRETGERMDPVALEKLAETSPYCNGWGEILEAKASWPKILSQAIESLPEDVINSHPALRLLMKNLIPSVDEAHDPNANGSC